MAKKQKAAAQPNAPPSPRQDRAERVVHWVHARKRPLSLAAVVLVAVAGAIWFVRTAQVRKETFAARALSEARTALDAGNLQLAASDLGRVVSTYAGSRAAAEAAILRAKVRLLQGDPAVAVTELRQFLAGDPPNYFEAPAAGLLGGALEEMGQYQEAADAFQRAADAASPYDLVRAEYLSDVGRSAALSGDTARAASAYQTILTENDDDAPVTVAAKLRLAELRRAARRS